MNHIKIMPTLRKELMRHKGKWPQIQFHSGVSYATIYNIVHKRKSLSNKEKEIMPQVDIAQRLLDVLYKIDQGKIELK